MILHILKNSMRVFWKKLELNIFLEKINNSPPLLFVPHARKLPSETTDKMIFKLENYGDSEANVDLYIKRFIKKKSSNSF